MKGLRLWAVGVVVLVVGAAVGLWLLAEPKAQTIALPDGREMHVLKVSLGTNHTLSFEPTWKQLARRLMPSASQSVWGAFTGERAQTRWEAMVVWLDGPRRSDRKGFFIDKAEAVFTNAFSPARVDAKSGMVRLTFPCFTREQKLVPIRVWQGTNVVEFQVANPRPVKGANWTTLPIPQTQTVNGASVVFSGFKPQEFRKETDSVAFRPSVYARASAGHRMGYVAWWHLTAFDRWGNYQEGRNGWPEIPAFSPQPPARGPWRIAMAGVEYLSVGFIPQATNQLAMLESPTLRMQDLGIRWVMLVTPGTFTITNAELTKLSEHFFSAPHFGFLRPNPKRAASKETTILATAPTGVCVSDVIPGIPVPRIRTHLRNENNEGSIYPAPFYTYWTNATDGVIQRWQIFEPDPTVSLTNRAEIEFEYRLDTEFFANPPEGY